MRPIELIDHKRTRARQRRIFRWLVLISLAALAAYVWVNMERYRKAMMTEAQAHEQQKLASAAVNLRNLRSISAA